jgi:hypothetical protein
VVAFRLRAGSSFGVVSEDKVWTAGELEQLTPNERDRIVRSGFVTDLSQGPADFLARARAKGRQMLADL